jgi:hypothetical protein
METPLQSIRQRQSAGHSPEGHQTAQENLRIFFVCCEGVKTTEPGVLEAGVIRMLKNLALRDFGYARGAAGFSSVRNASPGQRAAELSN